MKTLVLAGLSPYRGNEQSMREPIHQEGSDSLADRTRAERQATRRGVRRYGILSGHFLWRWIGVPSVILFACAFAPLLFFGGRLLWECLEGLRTKER